MTQEQIGWVDRQFERLADRMWISGDLIDQHSKATTVTAKKKLDARIERVGKGFNDIAKEMFKKLTLADWVFYVTSEDVDKMSDYTIFLESMRRMAEEADKRINSKAAVPSDFAKKYIGQQVLKEYFERAAQGKPTDCFSKTDE